jgi:hypothetical protein
MPSMSADRRQVNANLRPSSATRLRASSQRRARLSALTLAALATGYYPDGSAPEPGFPPTSRAGVLPAWPFCRRLSTLRADRSFCRSTGDPEPPGSGLAYPPAGTAPRFRLSGLPFRKGALNERVERNVTDMRTKVKSNVSYTETTSKQRVSFAILRITLERARYSLRIASSASPAKVDIESDMANVCSSVATLF